MSDESYYCDNCKKVLNPGDKMLTIGDILGIKDAQTVIADEFYFCSFNCGEEWIDKDEDEW